MPGKVKEVEMLKNTCFSIVFVRPRGRPGGSLGSTIKHNQTFFMFFRNHMGSVRRQVNAKTRWLQARENKRFLQASKQKRRKNHEFRHGSEECDFGAPVGSTLASGLIVALYQTEEYFLGILIAGIQFQ